MNQDERKATMDANLPEVTSIHSTSFYFNWSWKGCGFGQMSMSIVDGKLEAMDEYMSRESVRKLLIAYANHVADNCSLEGERAAPSSLPRER